MSNEEDGRPGADFQGALGLLAELQRRDATGVHPEAHTRAFLHDGRAERSVVLLHGLTSSPRQFAALGQLVHEQGANVLIPRLPRHGLADKMTGELANLTVAELLASLDEALRIAHGLGERVTVSGISLGGTMAGWAGQFRSDVDRALMISPLFSLFKMPVSVTGHFAAALSRMPNRFFWWHPLKREAFAPPGSYPRLSTKSLADCLMLGLQVEGASRMQKPAAGTLLAVINAKDPSVNNAVTEQVVRNWRRLDAPHVRGYRFRNLLPKLHDIITPERIGERKDTVYPIFVELMTGSSFDVKLAAENAEVAREMENAKENQPVEYANRL